MGRRGYLLKPTTPPIALNKDAATTSSLPAASVLTPDPMPDASVITAQSALVPDSTLPRSLTEPQRLQTPLPDSVEPILDVRADFADACQIGRSGNRWFLLFVDKTTEYVSIYNTKTRSSPLALLKEYLTFTGKKIRYLRMDMPKNFALRKFLFFAEITVL